MRFFRQPESSNFGDCPICLLPLSIEPMKSNMMECCSKQRLNPKCPFCRHPAPKTEEEFEKNRMKRVEANDPVAISQIGANRHNEGDYNGAFEYWTKAAGLGDV